MKAATDCNGNPGADCLALSACVCRVRFSRNLYADSFRRFRYPATWTGAQGPKIPRIDLPPCPAGTPVALRVFGHKQADACRTDLEIPLQPLDPKVAAAKIAGIQAMNLAR